MIANNSTHLTLPTGAPGGSSSLPRPGFKHGSDGDPGGVFVEANSLHGCRRERQRWLAPAGDHRTIGPRWSNCKASPFHQGSQSAQP